MAFYVGEFSSCSCPRENCEGCTTFEKTKKEDAMKNKVGNKYIIEIDREYAPSNGAVRLFGVKGFKTLVFDEEGLNRLKEYDQPMVSFPKEEDFKMALEEEYERGRKRQREMDEDSLQTLRENADHAYRNGYETGLLSIWEALRYFYDHDNKDRRARFKGMKQIVSEMSAQEFADAICRWELGLDEDEEHFISPGDEVRAEDSTFIATYVSGGWVGGIDYEGSTYDYPEDICRKTGLHVELGRWLRALRGYPEKDEEEKEDD